MLNILIAFFESNLLPIVTFLGGFIFFFVTQKIQLHFSITNKQIENTIKLVDQLSHLSISYWHTDYDKFYDEDDKGIIETKILGLITRISRTLQMHAGHGIYNLNEANSLFTELVDQVTGDTFESTPKSKDALRAKATSHISSKINYQLEKSLYEINNPLLFLVRNVKNLCKKIDLTFLLTGVLIVIFTIFLYSLIFLILKE
ncbi:hypothetical protein [Kiloniella antarctica]|uniref:Chemotaxis methyl-accepting receptor HlyB-like 4HB MCP domain-containing protein n=1 Tax=Kiloniella antarctica TaxID=1550907 RepID=A0ABW5BNV4_9PROT